MRKKKIISWLFVVPSVEVYQSVGKLLIQIVYGIVFHQISKLAYTMLYPSRYKMTQFTMKQIGNSMALILQNSIFKKKIYIYIYI